MQIRTPKKYQGAQRRSIISCRRLAFYAVMLSLIAAGVGIYLNRQVFAPIVQDALDVMIVELEGRGGDLGRAGADADQRPDQQVNRGQ